MVDQQDKDSLGGFADIADLLEDQEETESIWDRERHNNFEYQDFLVKEENRLKKLDQLFTKKSDNFATYANPQQLLNNQKILVNQKREQLVKDLLPLHSSLHEEIKQMWGSLFNRI